MRLLIPLSLLLIGVMVGIAATVLFKRNPLTVVINTIVAFAGAIFGLWIRDILDLEHTELLGAALAALLGACVVTTVMNVVANRLADRNQAGG